jgi:hypothetical protein
MSRQQFTNRNNINSVLTFQKSGSTASFDPLIMFSGGSRRVSWKLDNGTNITQTAGNSITYTGFTSDAGIRTIQMNPYKKEPENKNADQCPQCGKQRDSVCYRSDPYASEIGNNPDAMHTCCDECNYESAMDI